MHLLKRANQTGQQQKKEVLHKIKYFVAKIYFRLKPNCKIAVYRTPVVLTYRKTFTFAAGFFPLFMTEITTLHTQAVQLLQQLIAIPSFSKEENLTADLIEKFLRDKGVKTHRKLNNIWAWNKHFDASKANHITQFSS